MCIRGSVQGYFRRAILCIFQWMDSLAQKGSYSSRSDRLPQRRVSKTIAPFILLKRMYVHRISNQLG